MHERWKCELRPASLREPRREVVRHVNEDVEAGDVDSPECRALRPSDCRAGHRVDLFDRIVSGRKRFENPHKAVHGHVVGDEPRRISGNDGVFSQTAIREITNGFEYCRVGFRRRNEFEQREVSRRVEEMRAEPVTPEIAATALRQSCDGQSRRVGADDRTRPAHGVDALQQRAFRVWLFDDRFDDPVRLCDALQILVEAARLDAIEHIGREKRIGFERSRALDPLARGLRRYVQHTHAETRVCQMGADLCAHGSRAQHGGGSNFRGSGRHQSPCYTLSPWRNGSVGF